jgi:hypothetical protein
MKIIIQKIIRKVGNIMFGDIVGEIRDNRLLLAKILIHQNQQKTNCKNLSDYEFKVFSQCGEDGILQHLISVINIENETFIEFGVQNYIESNTRFLLINNNWRGLVFDGSSKNINYIKNDQIYWQFSLIAEHLFIDKNNINERIKKNNLSGDVGLLSIDIDGNDYWIWDAISVIQPRIIVCEYNSLFGYKAPITVPYRPDFNRTEAHYSNLYFGASISALTILAKEKGYSLVASNSEGSNIFFVRNDLMKNLKELSPKEAYVRSKFRESRDPDGQMTFLSFKDRLELIKEKKVVNIVDSKVYTISEII